MKKNKNNKPTTIRFYKTHKNLYWTGTSCFTKKTINNRIKQQVFFFIVLFVESANCHVIAGDLMSYFFVKPYYFYQYRCTNKKIILYVCVQIFIFVFICAKQNEQSASSTSSSSGSIKKLNKLLIYFFSSD